MDKRTLSLIILVLIVAASIVAYVEYSRSCNLSVKPTLPSTPLSNESSPTQTVTPNTSTTTQIYDTNNSQGQVEEESLVLKSFNSYSELVKYLEESSKRTVSQGILLVSYSAVGAPPTTYTVATQTVPVLERESSESLGRPYSKTNIQVSGVDEADIVKTDGEYIYVARGTHVYIVKAYPPNQLKITSVINIGENTSLDKTSNTSREMIRKNINIKGLYVRGDKLIIIIEEYRYKVLGEITIPVQAPNKQTSTTSINATTAITVTTLPPAPRTPAPGVVIIPPIGSERTLILVYDIGDKNNPRLLYNTSLSGNYVTSRMIDNYLYVLVDMPAKIYDYSKNKYTILVPKVDGKNISVDKIYYIVNATPTIPVYTIVLALDIDSGKYEDQVIIKDYTSRIYMSRSNLYILVEKGLNYDVVLRGILEKILPHLPRELAVMVEEILSNNTSIESFITSNLSDELFEWFESLSKEEKAEVVREVYDVLIREYYIIETDIYKFTVKGLELKLVAMGRVPGRVLDQFAMDEYKGYFRVATTSVKPVLVNTTYNPYIDIDFNTVNNVYILNKNLEIVGKLEDIAPSEQVYSARFLGDILFLVTYRRIDPLFAINLSDPEKPEIIGYVKIPGYSEYLHPYRNHLLIGIGVETNEYGQQLGLKISVFNITDLHDIEETSTIVLRDGYITSPVLYDHHAFVLNYEKNYMLIPVYGTSNSGVYMIVLDPGTGELKIKGYIPLEHPERALYIDDVIYAIGGRLLIAVNENLEELSSIKLSG